MYSIDINCDIGESFGAYKIGNDEKILEYVSSANIACGFHAGDPGVMRRTVQAALEKNVSIGAHVGFPDLSGFGRRKMQISFEEAYEITVYQIGALYGFVKAFGGKINHVKPHGAFYNMAAQDEELARAIAEAVYHVDPTIILFGLSGSKLIKIGDKVGIKTLNEVFADRTYTDKATLTPRSQQEALIENEKDAINQVVKMVKEGKVISTTGKKIDIKAETICIHGDGARAISFAQNISEVLKKNNIIIESK